VNPNPPGRDLETTAAEISEQCSLPLKISGTADCLSLARTTSMIKLKIPILVYFGGESGSPHATGWFPLLGFADEHDGGELSIEHSIYM
jgi:hypothetical protein